MNAVIDETEDKEVKLGLIENQLQDLCQIICDIYSRYLFEKAVFDRRSDEFLFKDQLNEIMLDAQNKLMAMDLIQIVYIHICGFVNHTTILQI